MCLPAIGAVVGIGATLAQGVMAKQSADYNAAMAEREGKRVRQMGAVQEAADRRQFDVALGQQKVDMAAAGRAGGTGTPLALAYESKLQSELDALSTRAGFQMRSENKSAEAGLYKFEGRSALVGRAFSAAGQLLGVVPSLPALG